MIEILGYFLDKYFEGEPEEIAKCTYRGDQYEVWEICDSMFGYMDAQTEEEFEQEAGSGAWWRNADGSILGPPQAQAFIAGVPLKLWHEEEREWKMRYENLTDYFSNHLGVSSLKNVCAVATDLARYNDMTLGELFTKCQ